MPAGGHAHLQRHWEQPTRLWPQALGAAIAGPDDATAELSD